jgi:hypothetical protein
VQPTAIANAATSAMRQRDTLAFIESLLLM